MAERSSEIRFTVHLDEHQVPEHIEWRAQDGDAESSCKATMISLWDEREQNTLRIDLWTKEMKLDEMKAFFHQNLLTMADTFERATGEKEMAGHMRAFGKYFGEEMLGVGKEE